MKKSELKENEKLILDEKTPQKVKDAYYSHNLDIQTFSDNLQYFEGKKVVQAFRKDGVTEKIIRLYGDNVYELFKKYKPLMDKIIEEIKYIEISEGVITKQLREEIMRGAILTHFNTIEDIENLSMLKMITDFVPLEWLPIDNERAIYLLAKYGIDKFIEAKMELEFFIDGVIYIDSLEQLKKLEKFIEKKDFLYLVEMQYMTEIEKYGIDKLLEYGIQNLSELSERINDLYRIKELLEKRPTELINMGPYGENKIKFIKKYGIENIIKLDEETNGIFSHKIWENKDIYLTLFSIMESRKLYPDKDKNLTYDKFRNKIYEILYHSKDTHSVLRGMSFPSYEFIQGKFREEHQKIFIDEDIIPSLKRKFYMGDMNAEDVRQNPELVQLLQGKDLSRVFNKEILGGYHNTSINMAEYLSEKIGQEEFLRICADYGKCLDNIITVLIPNDLPVENIREKIEETIYMEIKDRGIYYFEDLPTSFQEKYPELFLPKEINKELREKFYEGNLSYEDIRQNPKIKDIILSKEISVGFAKIKYGVLIPGIERQNINKMWKKLTEQEIINLAELYGDYLKDVDEEIFTEGQSIEEREATIQKNIEENILNPSKIVNYRKVENKNSPYNENVPKFFKEKYPEMFLDEKAPIDLKKHFYDYKIISFNVIKKHPEWKEFLEGKELRRAFGNHYKELFDRFDSATLLKLGIRNPETIEKMVEEHKESILESWYKSTGGKFIPHHIVMLNFPETEIDSFLANSKKWSKLTKLDDYNLYDEVKRAILKAAYSMGVFHGNDDGLNKIIQLFTDIPQELSKDEYQKVIDSYENDYFKYEGDEFKPTEDDEEMRRIFEKSYSLNDEGKYILKIDKQKNKKYVRIIREMLQEDEEMPKILTLQKAHEIFDSFKMEYNPEFVKFFDENIHEILRNPEYTKDIAAIQRQFKDIVRTNSGRTLTLKIAQDYIKNIIYTDIEIGNEGVAEQAKIAGYSQTDFEMIQKLYNEGEEREFSSIPRIQGENKGYTYEMLRCDDPLALTIGTLTDCCQEIYGIGQSSMEHSVVSPDGRIFVVRNEEGKIVAQSWFWRNQYTGCFDNIEIPDRIFKMYEKQQSKTGKKRLATEVLEVYKKAAQDLIQEDKKVYQELLKKGEITQEQYNSLLLSKITIGLGYNDIANAIKSDKTMHEDTDTVKVKATDRLPKPYTDAKTQYTIIENEKIVKSKLENLYVHEDEIPVYDASNMTSTVLLTMKRMEQETDRYNLEYIEEIITEEEKNKSQEMINNIAREYGFNAENTKVMATARIALIYSQTKDKITIGELLSSPLKSELTKKQKEKAQKHIKYQIKKALKQLEIEEKEVDISSLNKEEQKILEDIIEEIQKEKSSER